MSGGFDRDAWKQDYATLKAALERDYSHLAWLGSPEGGVDLPALDRRMLAWLDSAASDQDAKAAILAFLRGLNDGHISEVAPFEAGQASEAPPLRGSETSADAACAALGFAPATAIAFSSPFESLPGFKLLSDGLSQPFRSGVMPVAGTRVGIVRIPRFRAAEFPNLCLESWNRLKQRGADTGPDAVREEADRAWLATLADRLGRLRQTGATTVIVDVGGNGGGNDLGDWATRLFTPKPVRSAPLLVASGGAGDAYFTEQTESLGTITQDQNLQGKSRDVAARALNFFQAQQKSAREQNCDLSWVWRDRRSWKTVACRRLTEAGFASGFQAYDDARDVDPRVEKAVYWASIANPQRGAWRGPVFVLTDQRTGSSAEMFTALMHDALGARTLGYRTLGLGCGFMGSPPPIVLPHSGLRFRVPNCVRLRSDGTDEVAGITPDIPIRARDGEDARARAMRLLETVAANEKGPGS